MFKKKALSVLLFAFLLGGFNLSAQAVDVLGDEPTGCTLRASFSIGEDNFVSGDRIEAGDYEDWGLICMVGTIHYVINWIFYLLLIAVMVMVLYGAFIFLTSSGDPTKTSKATKTITFAVIGMIIALLARAVPAAVIYITGLG